MEGAWEWSASIFPIFPPWKDELLSASGAWKVGRALMQSSANSGGKLKVPTSVVEKIRAAHLWLK